MLSNKYTRKEEEAYGKYKDIHMYIEEILTKKIGDAGKCLHTARSRNDQVALDMDCMLKRK